MTWSYGPDSGSSITTDKDRVRLLIGDTLSGSPLLHDEEIISLLEQSGDSVYLAASVACSTLAAKFTTVPHVSFGNEHTITGAEVASQFRRLSDQWMMMSASMEPVDIVFTGQTWTEYYDNQADYDLKDSPFDDVGDSSTPYRTYEDEEWLP